MQKIDIATSYFMKVTMAKSIFSFYFVSTFLSFIHKSIQCYFKLISHRQNQLGIGQDHFYDHINNQSTRFMTYSKETLQL